MSDAASIEAKPLPAAGRLVTRGVGALERDRVSWAVLGVAMAAYAILEMWLTRGSGLFVDGVNLFLNDRGFDIGALLAPLNGHLVLMERSVYAVGLGLFGADTVLFRLVAVAGTLLASGALFALVKGRVGGAAALVPAILLLFLGTAWEVVVLPDGMTNTYCLAAGLGAMMALDRRDRRGDAVACGLLVASVCCWTLGAIFAVGAGVRIALEPERRRRLWVAALPLALYAVWMVWVRVSYVPDHSEVQNLYASNILVIPNFIASEAALVAGAAGGLGHDLITTDGFRLFEAAPGYGLVLAVAAIAAIVGAIRRNGASPAFWGAVVVLLAFWVTLAVGFSVGRTPGTVRYAYPGAALAFVVGAEALRGVWIPRWAVAASIACLLVALGANLARFRDGAELLRHYSANQRAQFTAIEISRRVVDPGFATRRVFSKTTAGAYLEAVSREGSPAFTAGELLAQPEDVRVTADEALVRALGVELSASPARANVSACHLVRPPPDGSPATLTVTAPARLLLRSRAPAPVSVRRFAGASTLALGTLQAATTEAIHLPRDAYSGPWYLTVGPSPAPVSICGGG